MNFTHEPEHISMLRDTLRRFVETEMPRDQVQLWDREHRSPPELFEKLAALRYGDAGAYRRKSGHSGQHQAYAGWRVDGVVLLIAPERGSPADALACPLW